MPEYLETTVDKFIFRVATDRLYSADGIWILPVEPRQEGLVRVGLTDYLQQRSGYGVRLPVACQSGNV